MDCAHLKSYALVAELNSCAGPIPYHYRLNVAVVPPALSELAGMS